MLARLYCYTIKMKKFIYVLVAILAMGLISCNDSDNDDPNDYSKEVEDLIKITEFSNDEHIFELYNESGKVEQGFNRFILRITDKESENFLTDAKISWKAVMKMTDREHGCPISDMEKVNGKQTLYSGDVIFQMPGNASEYWTLTFDYKVNGTTYSVSKKIDVEMSDKRKVTVFMGDDGTKYVLALIEPVNPEVKINDITMGLYKMENMFSFPVVKDYMIELDPRMPGMDNHSSPNNEDLVYSATNEIYEGKLSLTMTGYWVLNLRLFDDSDTLVKGEIIDDDNEKSSLFLEIEF